MKKTFSLVILGILLITCIIKIRAFIGQAQNVENNTVFKVLISQVVDHPALNLTTKGIIAALEQQNFIRDKNLIVRVESAQANAALAAQIASKFVHQMPTVVVGVGTTSAQSLAKYAVNKQTKLIFSSVTDPLSANLVQTLLQPGNNTSGVSNFVDLAPQLQLFKKLQPTLSKLGVLYNPGETNSVSIIQKLQTIAPDLGITLILQTITKTAEVGQATTKVAQQAEAIFISNDNTALSSLPSIIQITNAAKIPLYVSDTAAVAQGALAALGPNQYNIGIQTGNMIAKVLNGADLNTLPVEFPMQTELYLNLAAAKIVGIKIAPALQRTAVQIIPERNND